MFYIHTTSFLAVSHIVLKSAEAELALEGSWIHMVDGQLEDGYSHCTLQLFNDLLAALPQPGDLDVELAEQLEQGGVIDLVDLGLLIDHLYFSLEPLDIHPNQLGFAAEKEYYIRGFLKPTIALPANDGSDETVLTALALSYELYQQLLRKNYNEPLAAYYAGLQNPLVMELARREFEKRFKISDL
ncbi:hypothetical protein [Aridibaculum aurantiacum]|uniref:hypothetical protein n=1 Tax=Aridibaculum aurantiacum TaxID=2810307 RepID=UPI001A956958|nr:hypothetical protein [Aridibaculum aurantiacum]